jgi:hypothetical protein
VRVLLAASILLPAFYPERWFHGNNGKGEMKNMYLAPKGAVTFYRFNFFIGRSAVNAPRLWNLRRGFSLAFGGKDV